MKPLLFITVTVMLFQSCIPLRIATNIEDFNVVQGNKFKRTLPKREMFVFQNSKKANQFYNYVDVKFRLNNENVYDDVPFEIQNNSYFFSFYEVDIPDKSLNIFPFASDILLNVALGNEEMEPVLSQGAQGVHRKGNWYIAIEVYSDTEEDCLQINSFSREPVLKYLRALKREYLSTHNYNEIVFKN